MNEVPLLIGGERRVATGRASFQRRDPVSGDVAVTAAAATPADALAAVEAAARAFPAWSASAPGERRRLLLRAADVLEALGAEFAQAMASETGATAAWAGFNVALAAAMLREAAALTTAVRGHSLASDTPGCLSLSLRQPAGVVLGIAPWNAPVILGVRAIATPLACANTVVLKASEVCPRTHLLIGEALQRAGFPPGVVNVISNAPADAAARCSRSRSRPKSLSKSRHTE